MRPRPTVFNGQGATIFRRLPTGNRLETRSLTHDNRTRRVLIPIAVMRAAGDGAYGDRLRGMIVVLWRAGLRIGEALALAETDLDPVRRAITIRRGKGGKRRAVGMDQFGWQHLDPWLEHRRALPVGALFCILHGPTRGRPWAAPAGPQRVAAAMRGQVGRRPE
jgi:integrase